jgi:excisionase family DNA binding protein
MEISDSQHPTRAQMQRSHLTVRDVARRTGRSQKTIYRYIRSGKLPADLVTTVHGKLYLIDPKRVEEAGLPLVHTENTALEQPAQAAPPVDSLTDYLRSENAELKAENRRLKNELDRALFILGVFRGKLEESRAQLTAALRGSDRASRRLQQTRSDLQYYRNLLRSSARPHSLLSWIRGQ